MDLLGNIGDVIVGSTAYTLTNLNKSLAELNRTLSELKARLEAIRSILDSLDNALASVGTDRLNVSVIGGVEVANMPTDYAKESKQILVDEDGHGQVDVLSMPPVGVEIAEKGFSDASDTPTRALVDSDRHVQVDVLSMPSISVEVAEKGFSDASDTPTRALVDSDRHVQVDVLSAANIDVALSTRASEYTLAGVKAGTDYLDDIYGRLDVALSSRASESTLSSFVGVPGSTPPSRGVALLGYDGAYMRWVRTTSDGKLLAVLG